MATYERIKVLPVPFLGEYEDLSASTARIHLPTIGEYDHQCRLINPRIHLKRHW